MTKNFANRKIQLYLLFLVREYSSLSKASCIGLATLNISFVELVVKWETPIEFMHTTQKFKIEESQHAQGKMKNLQRINTSSKATAP